MNVNDSYLAHYGVKRRSGRYPWGSGDNPYQHSGDFLSRYEELKKTGLSDVDIAKQMECVDGTDELRTYLKIAKHERKDLQVARAKSLRDDGKTLQEIADEMGLKGPSSAATLLNDNTQERRDRAKNTADVLRQAVADKRMVDVGKGTEQDLNISNDVLKESVKMLELEGYNVYGVGAKQPMKTGVQTTLKVLCDKDVTYEEVMKNKDKIMTVTDYASTDGGKTYKQVQPPSSISSDRVAINYRENGGLEKDGVIEIRPGVADLDLGPSHYAQVRILVDGTHYLKGMAVYSPNVPEGADIAFNTNKSEGTPKMECLKKIKDDPDNPFGAAISAKGQSTYIDKDGNEKLSPINKLKWEGDWNDQKIQLSAQFLSKQPIKLIKNQLDLTYADYADEYDKISKLTNPALKQKLLRDFGEKCDSASVELYAAALPRQRNQVLLPVSSLKSNEVYAPAYENGEQLALIRYPHAGTFEIPVLTVNNKNKEGKVVVGQVRDAVGINSETAQKLSGADFDGDSVTVIPLSDKVKIASRPALEGLKTFDGKLEYPYRDGIKVMTKREKGIEMGKISNLITDMTLKDATDSELERAVKHSMVVIDAEKHKLDYKRSERENGIQELKERYQTTVNPDGTIKVGGVSTLISRSKHEMTINKRIGGYKIDKETGKKIYTEDPKTHPVYDRLDDGTYVLKGYKKREEKVPWMSLVDDAFELSSGTTPEKVYANYINKMKALANKARKESVNTPNLEYSSAAKQTYAPEVAQLNAKLKLVKSNLPKERRAINIANARIDEAIKLNPSLTDKDNKSKLNKLKTSILNDARREVGASATQFEITDREWEAIQAGAITHTTLKEILNRTDQDKLRERAMPKQTTTLSTAEQNRIKRLQASGYTIQQIADAVGRSVSTVNKYMSE